MSVNEALSRLGELAGPDRVGELVDDMVSAFADYRLRHQADTRLTEGEAEALTAAGVNVDVLAERSGPGAYLAAASASVLADALTVSEAHDVLGVSEERVRQRLREAPRTLVGIRINGGQWRLPAFQFAHGAAVATRGGPVVAALPEGLSPRVLDAFFAQPNDVLRDEHDEPMSPTAWIAEGRDLEPLVELAAVADMVP